MKALRILCVIFMECSTAMAVRHLLQHIYIASSKVPGLPQFVAVDFFDGRPFIHYKSNTTDLIPRQKWMKETERPEYWEKQTNVSKHDEQRFKAELKAAKQQFNHAEGVHTLQRIFGCDWDEETGEVSGHDRYGYDGEDFISLNYTSMMWVADKKEALRITQEWNKIPQDLYKLYITHECPEVLKKHVSSAGASLSKVSPTVSLLQRTPSSPVTCLATGFYPDRADVSWRRDGDEPQVDVDKGQIVPNNDGTFQMSVSLNVSSVRPEDWRRFSCVFQFSGDEESITISLDRRAVRTNWRETPWVPAGVRVGVLVVGVLVGVPLILLIVWIFCRRRGSACQCVTMATDIEQMNSLQMNEGNTANHQTANGGMENYETVNGGMENYETVNGGMENYETVNGGMENYETVNGGMENYETVNGGMDEHHPFLGGENLSLTYNDRQNLNPNPNPKYVENNK